MPQCVRITKVSKDSIKLLLSVLAAFLTVMFFGLVFSFGPTWVKDLQQPKLTVVPGAIIKEPAKEIRDFTLINQDGQAIAISSLRGKAVIMFFGYAHCPDYCPLTLAHLVQVKKDLGANAEKVNFVMITVDGERDTPTVLKEYIRQFDPSFIALTADPETVRGIGSDYGVQFQKERLSGTRAEYIVAHTTFTYLIDAQGRWRVAYPFDVPREAVSKDVQRILAEE